MEKYVNLRADIALWLCITFFANTLGPIPVYAQAEGFVLPAPGKMVELSPSYSPIVLKGIKLDPKNPFRFHFYIDTGDQNRHLNDIDNSHPEQSEGSQQEQLKQESAKLIKYFLASLTIPEKDLWVNLSPYEKDRIIPQAFGQTEMGRDLLAQDYILKQITASLIYPESRLGKEFWNKVYAQTEAKYGTTNIPINTFNKVWIVPEKAVVYENGGVAFVLENHLKVMLEQDYLSLNKHECRGGPCVRPLNGTTQGRPLQKEINSLGSQVLRQIIIPVLTKEVNEGQNFAPLRQVFYSLILATWYKKKIRDSVLNKIYADRNKIRGVQYNESVIVKSEATKQSFKKIASQKALAMTRVADDQESTHSSLLTHEDDIEYIYQQYIKAFKKGVYNYIKEEPDEITGQTFPRKYFSGGVLGVNLDAAMLYEKPGQVTSKQLADINNAQVVEVSGNVDFAMTNPVVIPPWFKTASFPSLLDIFRQKITPSDPMFGFDLSSGGGILVRVMEKVLKKVFPIILIRGVTNDLADVRIAQSLGREVVWEDGDLKLTQPSAEEYWLENLTKESPYVFIYDKAMNNISKEEKAVDENQRVTQIKKTGSGLNYYQLIKLLVSKDKTNKDIALRDLKASKDPDRIHKIVTEALFRIGYEIKYYPATDESKDAVEIFPTTLEHLVETGGMDFFETKNKSIRIHVFIDPDVTGNRLGPMMYLWWASHPEIRKKLSGKTMISGGTGTTYRQISALNRTGIFDLQWTKFKNSDRYWYRGKFPDWDKKNGAAQKKATSFHPAQPKGSAQRSETGAKEESPDAAMNFDASWPELAYHMHLLDDPDIKVRKIALNAIVSGLMERPLVPREAVVDKLKILYKNENNEKFKKEVFQELVYLGVEFDQDIQAQIENGLKDQRDEVKIEILYALKSAMLNDRIADFIYGKFEPSVVSSFNENVRVAINVFKFYEHASRFASAKCKDEVLRKVHTTEFIARLTRIYERLADENKLGLFLLAKELGINLPLNTEKDHSAGNDFMNSNIGNKTKKFTATEKNEFERYVQAGHVYSPEGLFGKLFNEGKKILFFTDEIELEPLKKANRVLNLLKTLVQKDGVKCIAIPIPSVEKGRLKMLLSGKLSDKDWSYGVEGHLGKYPADKDRRQEWAADVEAFKVLMSGLLAIFGDNILYYGNEASSGYQGELDIEQRAAVINDYHRKYELNRIIVLTHMYEASKAHDDSIVPAIEGFAEGSVGSVYGRTKEHLEFSERNFWEIFKPLENQFKLGAGAGILINETPIRNYLLEEGQEPITYGEGFDGLIIWPDGPDNNGLEEPEPEPSPWETVKPSSPIVSPVEHVGVDFAMTWSREKESLTANGAMNVSNHEIQFFDEQTAKALEDEIVKYFQLIPAHDHNKDIGEGSYVSHNEFKLSRFGERDYSIKMFGYSPGYNTGYTFNKDFYRIGPLFFLDAKYQDKLPEALKISLGNNVIYINEMNTSSVFGKDNKRFMNFTFATILAMLNTNMKDHIVVDAGAGEGILSLVAKKLGAKQVVLIEDKVKLLLRAKQDLLANGFVGGHDFRFLGSSITDNNIVQQLAIPSDAKLTFLLNIGKWHYSASNKDVLELVKNYLNFTYQIILRGYSFSDINPETYVREHLPKEDIDRVKRMGFVVNSNFANVNECGAIIASKLNQASENTVKLEPSTGGIDLNPAQMSLQIKKDGQDFKFDFNGTEIDAAQITGATFNIRTMTPVTNLPQELGLMG